MKDQHSIRDNCLFGHHSSLESGSGNSMGKSESMLWPDIAAVDECRSPSLVPQDSVSHSFSLGSTVQLLSDPIRYGVIQWIGTLPGIEGYIAGVELEEPMHSCGDGIWNGVQYFSCRQAQCGYFCPLSSLSPDQRFSPTTTAAFNPLDDVPLVELHYQSISLGQTAINHYIGERKGIQGHQNSCYLDSTMFGLFAVSDVFDSIFLKQQQGDPDGDEVKNLLWKGIVNPLRKHGIVRYESVMKLRDKLEELGKMKGVNQDEKDPEEFLNMLFNHTLHVPPFISIKRPFGVEDEYFVQLFVEHDESLKLLTTGDLLKRMFEDQNITFTKVPSKLLIQVPRYGREFKTYQKIIPDTKLEVKNLLCPKYLCFVCGDSAWKNCHDCAPYFTTDASSTTAYFCENCAKLAHGQATKRDKHRVSDVDTSDQTELDLLSVICIETSHYVCFTRSENRWIFFDSYASRINKDGKGFNIPKVVNCTDVLNEWVYASSGNLSRLSSTPPRELPEYVRRFTQDIYLCVYIQPHMMMYGEFEDEVVDVNEVEEYQQHKMPDELNKEFKAKYEILKLEYDQELQKMATQKESMEKRLLLQGIHILKLERKLETANAEVKEVRFTQLLNARGADSSWNVARNEVIIKEEIGRGASGLVSKGQFHGQNVAVKQIHQFILIRKHIVSEFKREVRIMARVQHPNLVRFIGAVFDESVENLIDTPLLLLELLHMNLRKAYETQPSSVSPNVMFSIFRDMAYGLHYLHEHQEPIIHRDVSAPNVLLEALPGGTWRAKLSDFGSANFLKRSLTLGVGAIVYTAPEMFPRDDPTAPMPLPTVKCDVFSYGIVLVEVITKTMPTPENRHQLFWEVETKWQIMHDLTLQCTKPLPDHRPTMSTILNKLNHLPITRS